MTVSDAGDFYRGGTATASSIGNQGTYVSNVAQSAFFATFQYEHVLLAVTNTDPTAYYSLVVEWTYSGGGTPGSGNQTLVIGPNQSGNILLEVQAPLVSFTTSLIAGALVAGAQFAVVGITGRRTPYGVRNRTTLLINSSDVLAANGTADHTAAYWYEGKVLTDISGGAGTLCFVEWQYYDAGLAGFTWFATTVQNGMAANNSVEVTFPPAPVRAHVVNGSTGQTVSVRAIPVST